MSVLILNEKNTIGSIGISQSLKFLTVERGPKQYQCCFHFVETLVFQSLKSFQIEIIRASIRVIGKIVKLERFYQVWDFWTTLLFSFQLRGLCVVGKCSWKNR